MLTIVDYGVGNLASIQNMLRKVGIESLISSDLDAIAAADRLILPGVGAFDTCADKLRQSGFVDILRRKVLDERTPVLGICVGMQLLLEGSEEGVLPGLGWIRGKVIRFRQEELPEGWKIPHMGWSEVSLNKPSRLFQDMYEEPRFYFVHSYHARLDEPGDAAIQASYGYAFTAGLEHENILGVQFHPEKSHKFGMRLLSNFVSQYA